MYHDVASTAGPPVSMWNLAANPSHRQLDRHPPLGHMELGGVARPSQGLWM